MVHRRAARPVSVDARHAPVPRLARGSGNDRKGDQLLSTPIVSAALGGGDAAASFADAFAQVHADCVRLAWYLTSSRDDAEDIAADVLATAWVRYERGGIDNLRHYLLRAVANRSRSWLRRKYVRARVHGTASGDDRGVRWHADDLADRDEMWTALRQLPTRQRVAVVLRYYEGLSVADVAEILGVREGTVKSNTSRGLARLEQLLTVDGADR
jgi:RNA polymerase sigma-70 factor (sigma-E family)